MPGLLKLVNKNSSCGGSQFLLSLIIEKRLKGIWMEIQETTVYSGTQLRRPPSTVNLTILQFFFCDWGTGREDKRRGRRQDGVHEFLWPSDAVHCGGRS